MKREALISIHPVFIAAILSGKKTVELRRRIPAIEVGVRLWLYSTRPVAALVGTAYVSGVECGSPDDIWKNHHANAGVCRSEFEAYYKNATVAHGISLTKVQNGSPVDIETLRAIKPTFHPPQVFHYISSEDAAAFERHLFGQ